MNGRNPSLAKAIARRKKLREKIQEIDPQGSSEYPLVPLGKFVDEVMEGKPKPTELRLPGILHDDGTSTPSVDAKDAGEPFWKEIADNYRRSAKDANGLVALVESLRALAINPEIVAGEESGPFASGLLKTVEGSYRGELMALFPSVTAGIAANTRHAPANTLKERILAECARHESGTQWKNRAARKVAPDAYRWNQEADKPFNWLDVAAAEKQIRRWLAK